MSQENVDMVRRAVEAVVARPTDWATVNAVFDPKHELVELTDFIDVAGARVGVAGSNVGGRWWIRQAIGASRLTTRGRRRTAVLPC